MQGSKLIIEKITGVLPISKETSSPAVVKSLVLLIASLAMACDLAARDPGQGVAGERPSRVSLILEQTFGTDAEPSESVLGKIAACEVDDQGNVYVVDDSFHDLASFSPDGSIRWRTGRRGEGPGEFLDVRGIATDGSEHIYVANRAGTQIDAFSVEGEHAETFRLPASEGGGVFLAGMLRGEPDALVLSKAAGGAIGAEIIIATLDDSVTAIRERFVVDTAPSVDLPVRLSSIVDVAVHGNRIFVGAKTEYKIRILNDTGELLGTIMRQDREIVRPGWYDEGGSRAMMEFGAIKPPVVLPTGAYLVYAVSPVNVTSPDAALRRARSGGGLDLSWKSWLDVFDESGAFLYNLQTGEGRQPSVGIPIKVGAQGKLFTVSDDPFPQVRRYRVEEQESNGRRREDQGLEAQ